MGISILCVQGSQFGDLISITIEILDTETIEKFKKHPRDFSYLQKYYFLFQFHVNLEYYISKSQIHVNFIDFNCYCHWFKSAVVGKQVHLYGYSNEGNKVCKCYSCMYKTVSIKHNFCTRKIIKRLAIKIFVWNFLQPPIQNV